MTNYIITDTQLNDLDESGRWKYIVIPLSDSELDTRKRAEAAYHQGIEEGKRQSKHSPDPLELLEAWITNGNDIQEGVYLEISGDGGLLDFINQLRTNPSAVREQGIKDGWYHGN